MTRVDTLDVCTSCISRCDQVAMLLINPSMRKESMLILIMLLHAVDPRVDTEVMPSYERKYSLEYFY